MERDKVLVIGDLIVDRYIKCEFRGIVPYEYAYDVKPSGYLPMEFMGGAGNIYRQLKELKANVDFTTIIGDEPVDNGSMPFDINCKQYRMFTVKQPNRILNTKIMYMVEDRIMFRVSCEDTKHYDVDLTYYIEHYLQYNIKNYHTIILCDYNKGLFTPKFTEEIISIAKNNNIFVIADVKPINASYFNGVDIIKCNRKEFDEIERINSFPNDVGIYVVTSGKSGTVVTNRFIDDGEWFGAYTNPFFKNAKSAGDIFTAGMVYGLMGDINKLTSAVKLGNKLASLSTSNIYDDVVYNPFNKIKKFLGEVK